MAQVRKKEERCNLAVVFSRFAAFLQCVVLLRCWVPTYIPPVDLYYMQMQGPVVRGTRSSEPPLYIGTYLCVCPPGGGG